MPEEAGEENFFLFGLTADQRTALEVLAANDVQTTIQRDCGVTPTPVISWAILTFTRRVLTRSRRDSLFALASPSLGSVLRCREDGREQRPDRSRRPEVTASRLRGAGRFQMVRARLVRRILLLRRRGERRGELPQARCHRVGDRQGRSHHGPARGRDDGAHRQGPRRALPRDRGRISSRSTRRVSGARRIWAFSSARRKRW